ncbi:bifunctional methylenetetrahydrofolate dehydrogenase/methenyltetrahydrofolate cyclohydrolase FolD [Lichenibacterium dinghuense]|uniref:bifunctional methylenetetrahydrofolate dehydrogenase/methenyltetrahydrofolate cyclohydrolase FolD n=1 Tax=Lichenibacterium dinghuense TaxID=2895977 RepID=UPI001F02E970|nr:bifunctional methylenetetrahydrofolate dehydrogenase/methenyltetrahydrofolate cyclohydrolase FolD [Lichenibacterium sp. 6Y81]
MTAATIIDGKLAAAAVIETVTAGAAALAARTGVRPGLAVVIVGEDPASQVYVASKGRMAESCGFKSVKHALPADTAQADLLALIAALNADPTIHGILLQLPLPKPLDPLPAIAAIDPAKDVDGLNEVNAGRVALGDFGRAFVPCTPAGSMALIRSALPDLRGRHAMVIGRSNLVGKPVAALLLAADCTVTMAHSRTADLPALCRTADVLVAAVGRPEMVKADWIKPGAVVIDVGINRVPAPEKGEGRTRLVGDVDFAGALTVAGAVTPVPGGVGPMTIAMLMENTLIAATRAAGVSGPPHR